MYYTLAITVLLLLVAFALLAVKIIFVRGGEFPKTHVSQSAAMRERGITCVQSQDAIERKRRGLYDTPEA